MICGKPRISNFKIFPKNLSGFFGSRIYTDERKNNGNIKKGVTKMAEELMAKSMNEDELAQVSGGTRIETYDIIKFYKSKGVEMPNNIEAAARKACILLNRDFNISVALNIQDNSDDSKNRYYDRHKKYSHAEIMDMLHKKYG